jgi:hypothetical protein
LLTLQKSPILDAELCSIIFSIVMAAEAGFSTVRALPFPRSLLEAFVCFADAQIFLPQSIWGSFWGFLILFCGWYGAHYRHMCCLLTYIIFTAIGLAFACFAIYALIVFAVVVEADANLKDARPFTPVIVVLLGTFYPFISHFCPAFFFLFS